jgi:hypothetical protein
VPRKTLMMGLSWSAAVLKLGAVRDRERGVWRGVCSAGGGGGASRPPAAPAVLTHAWLRLTHTVASSS